MKTKALFINGLFIFNALTQLLSQIIVTRIFGAKLDLEIYLAAVALPTLFVSTIYSTLNDAFLPLYGEKKVNDTENSDKYFINQLLIVGIFSFLAVLLLTFSSEWISHFLYQARGEEFIKNVSIQMNYMFYSLPLAIIATLMGAYYYSHKQFYRFPLAQAIGNTTNVIMIFLLTPLMGIWSLVFAFVVNIFFQIAIVFPPRKIFNSVTLFNVRYFISNTGRLFACWFPLIIGYTAFRSESVFIRSFASSLPVGYFVYLNMISKIFTLATGVMTIGIQILLLPHLVEYFSNKDSYLKGINLVNKAKLISIFISVIVSLSVMLFSPLLIQILFVGGKFNHQDAQITISLLPFFVIPAIGWGIYAIFFQPLLALKKQPIVAVICVISLVLGWLCATFTKQIWGAIPAISTGLIILLSTGIIGSEIVWQYYQRILLKNTHSLP